MFIIPITFSLYGGTCIQILLPKTLPTVRFLQFWPKAPMFWCYRHTRWEKNNRVMCPTMKEQRHRRLSFVIEWGAEESSFPKWPKSSQVTTGPPQESSQAACHIYIGVHIYDQSEQKQIWPDVSKMHWHSDALISWTFHFARGSLQVTSSTAMDHHRSNCSDQH